MSELEATPQNNEPAPSGWAALPHADPPKPLVRTWQDRVFALGFYLIGYLYVRCLLLAPNWPLRWTLPLFAALYAAAVLSYFHAKELRPAKWSWLWLAILLGTALGRGLWPNRSLLGFDVAVVHATALYWPLCAAGAARRDGTSSLLPVDALNAAVIVPFGNLWVQFRCLFGGWQLQKNGRKQAVPLLCGVAVLVLILALVVPLLSQADEGFARVVEAVRSVFRFQWSGQQVFMLTLAVPIGAYLFGLSYGAVHRRHTEHIREDRLAAMGEEVRIAPNLTLSVVLGGVCAVYALFIAVQAQSLFSAFFGRLTGTDNYSTFAREGFFQLCWVASINGGLLLAANLLAALARPDNRLLRVFNVVLAVLTLLILTCAARKMLLYIQAGGLTPKRVLTMAFMAMLAVLFVGVIVWQRKRFNLIRMAVAFAAVLFLALALCNLDHWITVYNAARGLPPYF